MISYLIYFRQIGHAGIPKADVSCVSRKSVAISENLKAVIYFVLKESFQNSFCNIFFELILQKESEFSLTNSINSFNNILKIRIIREICQLPSKSFLEAYSCEHFISFY